MKPQSTAISFIATLGIVALFAGCAHPPTAGHVPSQSNVPSPLADIEAAASNAGGAAPAKALDQRAVDALSAMGNYLHSLHQFEVEADTSSDTVLGNGQNAASLRHTVLKVRRPDRLRADISGDDDWGIVYDGRHFAVFDTTRHEYSRNDAPPTLDEFVHELEATWNVDMPLSELFSWSNGTQDSVALSSAQYVGSERIDARWCEHYAYRQPGVDWELWVERGKRPLPCRFVVTDTTQASRPRHEVTYRWNLNPALGASTFAFRPRADEKQIDLKTDTPTPYD